MRSRHQARLALLCGAAMVALYPGFYIYQSALAAGIIPSFLGGYFGLVSVVLLVPLVFYTWRAGRYEGRYVVEMDIAFTVTVIFMAVWSLCYFAFGEGYQTAADVLEQSISTLVLWVVNYLIFRGIDIESRWLRIALWLSFAVMFSIALSNQQGGFYYARAQAGGYVEMIASYQGFARSALVVLVMLMSVATPRLALPIYAVGMIWLFLLGARSEFAAFAVIGATVGLLKLGALRLLIFAIPCVVLLLFAFEAQLSNAFDSSRIGRLMSLSSDNSFLQRMEFASIAVRTISEHPILGDFGSHTVMGGIGGYAHNMLSAWVAFGLVGFLLFSYLLLSSLWTSFQSWRMQPADPLTIGAVAFALGNVFFALTSKSVFTPLFSAAWGLTALVSLRSFRRRGRA